MSDYHALLSGVLTGLGFSPGEFLRSQSDLAQQQMLAQQAVFSEASGGRNAPTMHMTIDSTAEWVPDVPQLEAPQS